MRERVRIVLWIFPVLLSLISCAGRVEENEAPYERQIETLLSEMTLEEKVGQMTQITIGVFYNDNILDKAKLKEYVTEYGVGSILNTPTVDGMSQAISLEEWTSLITLIQKDALNTRLKIPVLYGIDAIHGATYIKGATLFPHNINFAASRNRYIAGRAARVTAMEVRASGVRWNFDPVVGVGRQPLWSRFEETFGEDPYLVTTMGRKVIMNYQGTELKSPFTVAACLKHYLGYPVPFSGKDRTPAVIPPYQIRETFLMPFRTGVKQGALTVMLNSGSVNGVPVHADKHLITDVLKNELGFDGLVVTDWEDIIYLWKQHHVARDNKEAVMMAVNAGVDMSMVPSDLSFYHDLISLVKEGKVPEERINDAVRRILRVKYRLGLFNDPFPEPEATANFGKLVYDNIALGAAQESMTLLKNDTLDGKPVLPLKKNTKVLLAGPAVNSLASLHGSWSFCWQGNIDSLYPNSTKSIRQAFESYCGKQNIMTVSPPHFVPVTSRQIATVKKVARKADVIVLCLGEDAYAESPGSIDDLTLPQDQLALARAAAATGKPVILVLTEGRPRIIHEIVPSMDAILLAYRPGSKGAEAIVNTLYGKNNPSGRLPFSYPRYSGNIIPYDAPVRSEKYYHPQWPFSYGLSYTTFAVTDLSLSRDTLSTKDSLLVHITVKNTGKRKGKYAVDLFVKDYTASITPPAKRLRRFKKLSLAPGESKTVVFKLKGFDFSYVGKDLKRHIDAGKMAVIVGDIAKDFYLRKE
jgi:beta-glucosidase